MEGRLLLKNCSIYRSDGRVRSGMAVIVEGGRIAALVPDAEAPVLPGDWEVACRGRLVMAGLVDCHTHLVGGQVVPTSGTFLLRSARARFDLQNAVAAALTPGEVEALTAWGIARSLRNGVTMAAEHLQAPSCVGDALEAQARVAQRLGMRLIISHATHSRPGKVAAQQQAEENAAFAHRYREDVLVRGAMGIHSSSTTDDALLYRVGELMQEARAGVHFHLAEHEDDLTATYAQYGKRVVPRLEAAGLLGPGTVASYARAVDRSEAERLASSRSLVALSPRAALAGEPGGGLESVLTWEPMMGLGTGGTGTLWQELAAAFATAVQIARVGRLLDPDGLMSQLLVCGAAELCSFTYGAPSGSIETGRLADLVVYDLVPAPDSVAGLIPQLLMQLGEVQAAWTIVEGRVVVREGQLLGHDALALSQEAARALESVWTRVGVPVSTV